MYAVLVGAGDEKVVGDGALVGTGLILGTGVAGRRDDATNDGVILTGILSNWSLAGMPPVLGRKATFNANDAGSKTMLSIVNELYRSPL